MMPGPGIQCGVHMFSPIDEVLMILSDCCFLITGKTSFVIDTTPNKFTPN
jgi:hypothetical protein